MKVQIAEIVQNQQAILDGTLVVTVIRSVEAGVIVDAGHGSVVVGPERLVPLA